MYKPHAIFTLFFFIVLCTFQFCAPKYSEYSSGPTTYINFRAHDDINYKESQSDYHRSPDFSYESPTVGSAPAHQPHFQTYDAQDFRNYFTARGYTEHEILDQRCLYMFDEFVKFAQTYSAYKCTIQQLHVELKKLNIMQKAYYTIKGTYCPGLQKRIHYLYDQLSSLKKEDVPASNVPIIRNHAFETFCQQQTEYKALSDVYHTYTPSLAHAIAKRTDAFNSMIQNGRFYFNGNKKSYTLTSNVEQLLAKYGHDTINFTQCYGHPLHQAVHQESIDILERVDNLSPDSVLYDHQEALVDFTVAMVDYNHEGMTDKAMQIGDLCWTLLDFGQAIAEGAVLGGYTAVTNILTDPIGTTANIVAGKYILMYQLGKVLYNVADIGVTVLTDTNQAKDKWNTYIKPLNDVIGAITHKETKARDIIKGGTAFAVGFLAHGRLLGGLGKFYNNIKQKTIDFIQNNPFAKPQDYATTSEGLLFKATTNSNKVKPSGQTNTASNLKNTVDGKVTKHKSIKRLIKQEELPTTGKLRYVPPKKLHSFDRLPHKKLPNNRIGFIDRFGNIWVKGPSRTKGQAHEWDVQLSKQGIKQVGWMTRDNSHLNVSLDGRVTHK